MAPTLIRTAKQLACFLALLVALPGRAIDSIPVRVTNPASAPVPVTGAVGVTGPVSVVGTVGISGTPAVNILSLPPVSINPATPLTVTVKSGDAASLFSVPLSVAQYGGPPLNVLPMELSLTAPAVPESVNADCVGVVPKFRMYLDAGPGGFKGTTAVGLDPSVAAVVGTDPLIPISIPYYFTPTITPDRSESILPVSPIGAPVRSGVQLYIYPDTTANLPHCNFNLVFRSIN
jgi:hypothetical protein